MAAHYLFSYQRLFQIFGFLIQHISFRLLCYVRSLHLSFELCLLDPTLLFLEVDSTNYCSRGMVFQEFANKYVYLVLSNYLKFGVFFIHLFLDKVHELSVQFLLVEIGFVCYMLDEFLPSTKYQWKFLVFEAID